MVGVLNLNFYFLFGDVLIVDEWFLVVGYVYLVGIMQEIRLDLGVYKVNGEKILSNMLVFWWSVNIVIVFIRVYFFYLLNILIVQQFYRLRVDLCDGIELLLGDLFRCKEYILLLYSYVDFGVYKNNNYVFGESVIVNEFIEN